MSVLYKAKRTKAGKKIMSDPALSMKIINAIYDNKEKLFIGETVEVEGVKIKQTIKTK